MENQERAVIEVMMVKDAIAALPEYLLPEGYEFRLYRTGDLVNWVRIHREAEPFHHVDLKLFTREFGGDEHLISLRQYYLCDHAGKEVGTATAWFNNELAGPGYGRIHWVAVCPDHQGRGLAKALTTKLCRRFIELGHTKALVTTENFRLNAIGLYRKFGFEPYPRNEQERLFWEEYER